MAKKHPVSYLRFSKEKIYVVEHRKTKDAKWTKRRYFFTDRARARAELQLCTGALGYYAARLRVWHPVAYARTRKKA